MAKGFIGIMRKAARDAARAQRRAEADQRRRQRERVAQERAIERERRRRQVFAFQVARLEIANQKEQERQARNVAIKSERERREQERLVKQQQKEYEQEQRRLEIEERNQYLADREEEAQDASDALQQYIEDLQNILKFTLSVDDNINFESLRIADEYPAANFPAEISNPSLKPDKTAFLSQVKQPGLLERTLGMKSRYEKELASAEMRYQEALRIWEAVEQERLSKLDQLSHEYENDRLAFELKKLQRNTEVDQLKQDYGEGDEGAVITYLTMVLERSDYPEGFPEEFRVTYSRSTREAIVDYELPTVEIVPQVLEYTYEKKKDEIVGKPRKPQFVKDLYRDVVASVALRTIHEIFESDQGNHIDSVVFNGCISSVDPATGKDIHPYVISARATKPSFAEINLARIDKQACLRNLGARVSARPDERQAVRPVVEFDMVDRRFVEQSDLLSALESRPNLMELNPTEFENLVSNLFNALGLDTKLTQASRDGGVDAIAFDTRPVIGGKVVIQAKRYKNTVGVSAVRDLYGTMQHEGASKGILVTTSGYGTDAYDFSKDKPLELIDGGGLLYLLQQIGAEARIIMPDD
jgi:restriction system protein